MRRSAGEAWRIAEKGGGRGRKEGRSKGDEVGTSKHKKQHPSTLSPSYPFVLLPFSAFSFSLPFSRRSSPFYSDSISLPIHLFINICIVASSPIFLSPFYSDSTSLPIRLLTYLLISILLPPPRFPLFMYAYCRRLTIFVQPNIPELASSAAL